MRTRCKILICFSLLLLTFWAYWPVRTHDFVYYDDPEFVTENSQVQNGLKLETVRYAFSATVSGNWHPLTVLSHALDCQLFGTNPRGHHLMNVVVHAINVLLLFLLLGNLTGAIWRSAFVAAIFALHPLRVESVAWIAERKDLLAGLFFLLSLWLYAQYTRRISGLEPLEALPQGGNAGKGQGTSTRSLSEGWRFYLGSVLCFAVGLMCKPMVVTLPFVLLLLDYWPLGRMAEPGHWPAAARLPGLLTEKVPYFALSALTSLITLFVQRAAGATRVINHLSLGERLLNAVTSYTRYLGKLIWPVDLAVIYPHPGQHFFLSDGWPAWEISCAAAFLVLTSVLFLRLLPRRPYLAIGWLWFLGMLIPVIGLVQAGEQAMADRYSYLPLIGPVLGLVWWIGEESSRRWPRPNRVLLAVVGVTLVATMISLTRHQLRFWQNTLTLFSHTVEVTADNPSGQFGVANGLLEQGEMQPAMVRLRVVLAIDPAYARAHYSLAQLLRIQGYLQASAAQYEAVLKSNPADVRALVNLAGLLPMLGRPNEAFHYLDEALRLDPGSAEALNNFAWLLATSPQSEFRDGTRAVKFAEQACALTKFRQPPFLGTLAASYAEAGRFAEAVATGQRAADAASAAGDGALAQRTQELLKLYRAGKPYRETYPALSQPSPRQ